ncbi:hypothetical protein D3875_16720 [Deinococcus cavernae]|uniref:Uncharacterized protein n=1 Tax=Deinococcus cavernae TaxID=2320857 RepID=A0A418V9Z6_9DEIO|nr:hypothetical protein D3875_16720 [Deinococcus cavernae]
MNRVWVILWIGFSLVLLLLSLLWFLQGTGLVVIPPVLCIGQCKPLTGPSLAWASTGFVTALLGAWSLLASLRKYRSGQQK